MMGPNLSALHMALALLLTFACSVPARSQVARWEIADSLRAGSLAEALEKSSSVEYVHIERASLGNSEVRDLGKLKRLNTLTLRGVWCDPDVWRTLVDVLRDSTQVASLIVDNCHGVGGNADAFFCISSLSRLKIRGKDIRVFAPSDSLSSHISSLELNSCNLRNEDFKLPKLPKLTYLTLKDNLLTDIPLSIVNLPSIEDLDIGSNPLRNTAANVARLVQLRKIRRLNIAYTQLTIDSSVGRLTDLEVLACRGTPMDSIPASLGALKHLIIIDVRDTRVQHLPIALSESVSLKVIGVSGTAVSRDEIRQFKEALGRCLVVY